MTGKPERNLRLTAARQRALKLLAGAPDGCTEAAMMAHGLSLGFLADLVREGLANERADRARMGNRELEVVRLSITDEGQRALDF
jgi:hypothetical protein